MSLNAPPVGHGASGSRIGNSRPLTLMIPTRGWKDVEAAAVKVTVPLPVPVVLVNEIQSVVVVAAHGQPAGSWIGTLPEPPVAGTEMSGIGVVNAHAPGVNVQVSLN